MKAHHSYVYYLPTWSEDEFRILEPNEEVWYDRLWKCGGIPRMVLWQSVHPDETDPMSYLTMALDQLGVKVIDYFFKNGFGNMDHGDTYYLPCQSTRLRNRRQCEL